MKITLVSEDEIRLEDSGEPITIEAQSADQVYSPFHMLASGLASCTFSVLHSWATHAKVHSDGLVVGVSWTFADDPHRVGSMKVTVTWTSLPPERRAAAQRAAALCTVHKTLEHPPQMAIEVVG